MAQPPTPTSPRRDPHKHLKEFHNVRSTMKQHDVMKGHICLKAFPHSLEGLTKTTAIRKDIYGIRQQHGESLYEYCERFKRLCASCPHHQISEQLLLQYFYEGLNNMDKNSIEAASGGALGDMTHLEERCFIEKMTSNSQQFNARSGEA
ncbi:hypothetical protein Lal_00032030 [Lupinus albus]|nr:hypothetical protein Lal_00032030 [Lupinus albus]